MLSRIVSGLIGFGGIILMGGMGLAFIPDHPGLIDMGRHLIIYGGGALSAAVVVMGVELIADAFGDDA